jgi:small-conductance mechanosensitive channel
MENLISFRVFKLALFTVIAVLIAFPAVDTADAQDTKESKSEDAPKEKAEPVPGLAELIRKASSLKTRLRALEKGLAKAYDFSGFEEKLTGLQNEIKDLKTDLEKLKDSESYSYDHLVELKRSIRLKMISIDKMIEPITDAIRKIELWQKEWTQSARQWEKWEKAYQQELSLNTVQTVFQRSEEIFVNARNIILEQLEPLLSAEHRLEEIRSQAEIVLAGVDALILAMRGGAAQSDTPSMFSLDYYRQFDARLVLDLLKNVRILSWPEREYFVREWWVIALQLVVVLAIAIGIKRHQPQFEQNRRSQFLAKRPWAAGIFFSIALLHTLHGELPQIWGLFLWALIAFAVVRLLEGYIKDARYRRLFYALSALLVISQIVFLLNLPMTLLRLYILGISLVGCIVSLRYTLKSAHMDDSPLYTWLFRLGGMIMLVILAAEVAGYSLFAQELLDGALKTIFFVLIFWLLRQFVRIGLELGFYSSPIQHLPLFQRNADVIIKRLSFIFNLILGIFIFASILVIWRIFDIPAEAINGILSYGFTVGSKKITIWLTLIALAVLYGAYLISWAIQEILMEDVLKRRRVEKGTRISISRLLHYALVLVGFIIALSVLGFDMKNITIIGGALGIGIGFGLQTIVSNFVSGLILLFERPLKVGDTIQLADQWGRVKHLGLRATVIETFDQAEVVVPNADLISGQVTNWTLADRRVRLSLPIGVAYGSDLALVMKTLTECARDHALVLADPEPRVIFSAFGASSLDFELRVWIADFDDRRTVQSDLLLATARRFRDLDIEIPFPQRDLHVRSVDESAAASVRSQDLQSFKSDSSVER